MNVSSETTSKKISINERRAEFVHDAIHLFAITSNAPVVSPIFKEKEKGARDNFLDAVKNHFDFTKSPESLHQSWIESYKKMGWVYGEKYDKEKRTHPDIVSYSKLPQKEKEKNDVFIALCKIARQFIY